MKFDPAHALDLAPTFADPDRTAALTSAFDSLGLAVDRIPVNGDAPRHPLLHLLDDQFLAVFALAPFLVPRLVLDHRPAYIVATLLALMIFGLLSRLHRSSVRSLSLEAHRPSPASAPVRVVFTTPLEIPRPLLAHRRYRLAILAYRLGFLVLYLVATVVDPRAFGFVSPFVPYALPILALGFEAAVIARFRDESRPPKTGPLDNRDGLAFLVELARTWPRRLDERIDAQFHAFGGVGRPPIGLIALHDRIRRTDPDRPTLVVGFWSPGLGPPFVIAANGLDADDPLSAAATGLRIPYEWAAPSIVRATWPFDTIHQDFVAILGARQNAPTLAIDAGSLALAAQLATEVSLRWARLQAENQPGVETRDRSSQNPG